MLEKAICAECGNAHASRACPLCGCRNREPISDATKLALARLSQQAATLAESLDWMIDEFAHDDHNLVYPRCNCGSHQHYHTARAALLAYKESK